MSPSKGTYPIAMYSSVSEEVFEEATSIAAQFSKTSAASAWFVRYPSLLGFHGQEKSTQSDVVVSPSADCATFVFSTITAPHSSNF
jgi:hypothetical protein